MHGRELTESDVSISPSPIERTYFGVCISRGGKELLLTWVSASVVWVPTHPISGEAWTDTVDVKHSTWVEAEEVVGAASMETERVSGIASTAVETTSGSAWIPTETWVGVGSMEC